jgi:hypothetical protein
MTITKNKKKYNEFTLKFTCTAGAILSIKHGLEERVKDGSPVAKDVLNELIAAIHKSNDSVLIDNL